MGPDTAWRGVAWRGGPQALGHGGHGSRPCATVLVQYLGPRGAGRRERAGPPQPPNPPTPDSDGWMEVRVRARGRQSDRVMESVKRRAPPGAAGGRWTDVTGLQAALPPAAATWGLTKTLARDSGSESRRGGKPHRRASAASARPAATHGLRRAWLCPASLADSPRRWRWPRLCLLAGLVAARRPPHHHHPPPRPTGCGGG